MEQLSSHVAKRKNDKQRMERTVRGCWYLQPACVLPDTTWPPQVSTNSCNGIIANILMNGIITNFLMGYTDPVASRPWFGLFFWGLFLAGFRLSGAIHRQIRLQSMVCDVVRDRIYWEIERSRFGHRKVWSPIFLFWRRFSWVCFSAIDPFWLYSSVIWIAPHLRLWRAVP